MTTDLEVLADLQAAFHASIADVDPAASVHACDGWTVQDLVVHLAEVHHWAASQARRRVEAPLDRGPCDLPTLYRACADELLDALRTLDPTAPAWALVDDGVPVERRTGTVAFWHRRQKLETLVHLWDLRAAGGSTVGADADDATWEDCVDEVVTVMHPRQVRLGRVVPPAVRLRLLTPGGRGWTVGGAPVGEDSHGAPEVTITALARDLALLLWGRIALDDLGLAVDGDVETARAVLRAGLTP